MSPDYRTGVCYCVLNNRLHRGTVESRIKLPTSHKALLMTSSQLNTAHLLLCYVGMENIQQLFPCYKTNT